MLFRSLRSSTFAALAAASLLAACALPGRGGSSSDDDDGGVEDDGSNTSTSTSGSGGAGSGGASSSGDTTSASGTTSSSTSSAVGSTSAATTSSTTGGGSCPTATLEFTDPVCGGCAESACCSQLQACDASFDCLDFLGCAQSCTDDLCFDACLESYPTGASLYFDLDDCLYSGCSLECG